MASMAYLHGWRRIGISIGGVNERVKAAMAKCSGGSESSGGVISGKATQWRR